VRLGAILSMLQAEYKKGLMNYHTLKMIAFWLFVVVPKAETLDKIIARGVGGRYLFMPDQGLWLGIDIASGPEATYWYINVGHAW